MVSDLPTVAVWAPPVAGQWSVVGDLPEYSALDLQCRFNEAGTWQLTVPYNTRALAVLPNRLVTFDWRDKRIMTGVITSFQPTVDETGAPILNLSGMDALSVIGWSLAWPAPGQGIGAQPYWDPNSPAPMILAAETMALNLIRQNVVTRRAMAVVVPASQGRGSTVRARPNFDNLLELVSKNATRGGVGVRVGLVDTSGSRADLAVSVYEPQDRSLRVTFSQALGSLSSWTQIETAPTVTKVVVGGAGSGANRVYRQSTGHDGAAATWGGHREAFVDGPQTFDNTELDEAADAALDTGAVTASLSVQAAESAGLLAFRDYDVGDIAAATLLTGLSVTDVITSIAVRVDDSGPSVTPTFGDPDAADPDALKSKLIRSLRREVSQLKRRR